MIFTILGGSAFSTPSLVEYLARQKLLEPITLRLAGRTPEHLMAVGRAARLLAEGTLIRIEVFPTDRWEESLEAADVVLVQLRPGGFEGREFDETFPPNFGIPGDEGLGPGGLSCALRSWTVIRQALSILQRKAPASLVLLLSSPGSLLARLAAREFSALRVYSICELPFTTLAEVCRASSQPLASAAFSYAGVNHLGWLYNVYSQGRDLIPPYIRQQKQSSSKELMRQYNAVPLKYFELHAEPQTVLRQQLKAGASQSRARQLTRLQKAAFLTLRHGSIHDIYDTLRARPTPWYSEAVGPLLLQSTDRPYFLSAADAFGEVEERAYRLVEHTLRAMPMTEPPPPIRDLNAGYMRYEKQAALAIELRNEEKLAEALAIHPWTACRQIAGELARYLCSHLHTRESERKPLLCAS